MTTTETVRSSDMTTDVVDTTPAPQARHKAVATELPPARRQSFLTLLRIELRKSVDTRSGRVLLAGILLLALAGLTWELTHLSDGPVTFGQFSEVSLVGVQLLLPVIGIMAMTSEWTQRTALTTFTLSPRRARVQLAKFLAAILLSVVVLTVVLALALGYTALGGLVDGSSPVYDTPQDAFWSSLAAVYLANALNVVMGAAFGAVLAQTAIAVTVYFIAPTLWSLAAPEVLKERADWLDVFGAFGRIAERSFDGKVPETLTAVAAWIVIPTILGFWISSRREAK
jgi:ABC-2 type transport system permease protein